MNEQGFQPNPGDSRPLIELRSVVKTYNSLAGEVTALQGIDLATDAPDTGQHALLLGR